jgi:hypothetical protein
MASADYESVEDYVRDKGGSRAIKKVSAVLSGGVVPP